MAKRATKTPAPPDRARYLPPAILFFATLAVRLIPFNVTLVGWDEWILSGIATRLARVYIPAHEWYDVLVPTGYSYPPVFFWLNGALIAVLGPEPLVFRVVTILSEAACVAAVCFVAQQLSGRFAAWAAGLLAFATLYLSFHETVTMDFLLSLWILLSALALVHCVEQAQAKYLVWALFLSSMAVFTKYHGVVYHAILCALIIAMPATRRLLRGRILLLGAVAALALPCALLVLEGLTWHFYGYEKTHIAEVFRVMRWTSYVRDPATGAVVVATWNFYLLYLWHVLKPAVCIVGAAGFIYALATRRPAFLMIAGIAALWFLWASTASLKNARYILPGVLLLYPLAGAMLGAWVKRGNYGRAPATALLIGVVAVGLWDTRGRLHAYLRDARAHQQVYDFVRDNIPPGAVIMAESAPFQWGVSLRVEAGRPMRNPEDATAFADADYAILHEWGRELIEAGAIPSAKNYLGERDRAATRWESVLDTGTGRERVAILRKR